MKFLLYSTAVLASTPTLIQKRQGAVLQADVSAIASNVATLETAVNNFQGAADADALIAASESVVAAISKGTTDANASPPLSELDAANLITPIQSLISVVNQTVSTLLAKKQIFVDSGRGCQVYPQLVDQKTGSQAFSDALVAKVPSTLQAVAASLSAPIIQNLTTAADAFQDVQCATTTTTSSIMPSTTSSSSSVSSMTSLSSSVPSATGISTASSSAVSSGTSSGVASGSPTSTGVSVGTSTGAASSSPTGTGTMSEPCTTAVVTSTETEPCSETERPTGGQSNPASVVTETAPCSEGSGSQPTGGSGSSGSGSSGSGSSGSGSSGSGSSGSGSSGSGSSGSGNSGGSEPGQSGASTSAPAVVTAGAGKLQISFTVAIVAISGAVGAALQL